MPSTPMYCPESLSCRFLCPLSALVAFLRPSRCAPFALPLLSQDYDLPRLPRVDFSNAETPRSATSLRLCWCCRSLTALPTNPTVSASWDVSTFLPCQLLLPAVPAPCCRCRCPDPPSGCCLDASAATGPLCLVRRMPWIPLVMWMSSCPVLSWRLPFSRRSSSPLETPRNLPKAQYT